MSNPCDGCMDNLCPIEGIGCSDHQEQPSLSDARKQARNIQDKIDKQYKDIIEQESKQQPMCHKNCPEWNLLDRIEQLTRRITEIEIDNNFIKLWRDRAMEAEAKIKHLEAELRKKK